MIGLWISMTVFSVALLARAAQPKRKLLRVRAK